MLQNSFLRNLQKIQSKIVCNTRLDKLVWDKHSNLLQKIVNYVHRRFYDISTWANVIKLFVHNLHIYILSFIVR
jgi:hypothetical protein